MSKGEFARPRSKSPEIQVEGPTYFGSSELRRRASLTVVEFRQLCAQRIVTARFVTRNNKALYTQSDVEKCRAFIEARNDGSTKRTAPLPKTGRPRTALRPNAVRCYDTESAQKVWPLLKERKGLDEIVLETGLHPLTVEQITLDYARLNHSILLFHADLQLIESLPITGVVFPIRSSAQIYDILEDLAGRIEIFEDGRTCVRCLRRDASKSCARCIKELVLEKLEEKRKAAEIAAAGTATTVTDPPVEADPQDASGPDLGSPETAEILATG